MEIALTDCFTLGTVAPVRESGDIDETPAIILKGPNGELKLKGLIVAKRLRMTRRRHGIWCQ